MNDRISYTIEYIQALVELQGQEQEGIALWLSELYQTIEEWRVNDASQLIRGAKRIPLTDWGRAQVFLGRGDFYARLQNWVEAVAMYKSALSVFESLQAAGEEQAIVWNNLGLVFQEQGRYDDAIRCYNAAIAFSGQRENAPGNVHALSNLASVYDERGDWAEAIRYYELGIETIKGLDQKPDLASLLNNLGVVLQKSGQLTRAESILQRCVDLLDGAAMSSSVLGARVLMNLGEVYADLDQAKQAQHCFETAIQVSQELTDISMEISAWNNLGTFYAAGQDTANAVMCYTKCLELAVKLDDRDTQALALNNLGSVYEDTGEFETAKNLYEQSLALSTEIDDLYGVARAYNNLGVLFEKQTDYGRAIQNYELAGKGLHEIADYYRETVTTINIASLYARMGNPAKAWEWHEHGLQLAKKYEYVDLLVSLAILDGDLNFAYSSNQERGCESYVRACSFALQESSKSLPEFIDIAQKRLAWLGTKDRQLLCRRLLDMCGNDLKISAPDFYEHLAFHRKAILE